MAHSNEWQGSVGRFGSSFALGILVLTLAGGCSGRMTPVTPGVGPVSPPEVVSPNYARADSFLGWNAARLVDGMSLANGVEGVIRANWLSPPPGVLIDSLLDDDRFWYVVQRDGGKKFILVDPANGTKGPAFDQDSVARGLTKNSPIGGMTFNADSLPFSTFRYGSRDSAGVNVLDFTKIRFDTNLLPTPRSSPSPLEWTCAAGGFGGEPGDTASCTSQQSQIGTDHVLAPPPNPEGEFAFVKDYNLWRASGGDSTEVSTDGVDKRGYGIIPEECCEAVTKGRWIDGIRPVGPPPLQPPYLAWSPDGTKIVTHLYDESSVRDLHLLETAEGRPVLHTYSYALPGDSLDALPRYKFFVFHEDKKEPVEIQADWMVDGFAAETFPIRWSGSDTLFFTRHDTSYKKVELVVADASTGNTRVVVTDTSETFINLSAVFPFIPANWQVLNEGREVIWYSERSGWGHLYRYDVATGELMNPITSGDWLVLQVKGVDEKGGWVYFTGLGKDPARDPYLALQYRARIDGTNEIELLTPEGSEDPTNHATQISPSGKFVLDTYSRRDLPGRTVLRSTDDGSVVMDVERMDISRLEETGWPLPRHFTVKARDGETDLHGFLHFPSYFDSTNTTKQYPVIDLIYPGPQIGPILSRSFSVQPFGDPTALAELGFIVFAMDAMGTPQRSKAFDAADYDSLASYAMADHITALKQLDARIPQIDLERIGIYGHSGGGAAVAAALIEHGDTFDVGVAGAGNHDDRSYYFAWANKYDGGDLEDEWQWLVEGELTGRLLITYGTMDDNVHPNNSLRLIDALIKNNENFDVLVLPNRSHDYMNEPYAIRKGWDYFVTHLLGEVPPWEYEIKRPEN